MFWHSGRRLDAAIEIFKAFLNIYVARNRWKVVVVGVNATVCGYVNDPSLLRLLKLIVH